MNNPVRTFSGAHPYRPQCVIESARTVYTSWQTSQGYDPASDHMKRLTDEFVLNDAERITTAIGSGICPRCSDPLTPDPLPDGWRPAGSRALPCRCVPVCERCANWIEPILGPLHVTAWPTDQMERDDEHATQKDFEAVFAEQVKANCTVAYLEPGPNGPVLVSDDGAVPVQLRPNPGGWLEHGYDDTADQRERQS